MVQVRIKELFAPEITSGIKQFTGGRDSFDYASMSPDEEDSVRLAFDKSLKKIENVSPKLAASIRPQREAFVKWAGIAKGTFPETKSYSYPATAGGLGADWITPEMYFYVLSGSASATQPAYAAGYNFTAATQFNWTTGTLTMGTANYLAGTGTAGQNYKGSQTTSKHSFVVLAQDGIIELGTSPKISQLLFSTDLQTKYAAIAMSPTIIESIEDNKTIYQYNTPGMVPMDHNVGTQIKLYPGATGTSYVPLLGMVFYEYDLNYYPRTTSV